MSFYEFFESIETDTFSFRPLHQRIVERLGYAQKSSETLERRKLYPVVKVYGGLFHARRQVVDDSFIREVKAAFENHAGPSSGSSSGQLSVEKLEDSWSSESSSVKWESPKGEVQHRPGHVTIIPAKGSDNVVCT